MTRLHADSNTSFIFYQHGIEVESFMRFLAEDATSSANPGRTVASSPNSLSQNLERDRVRIVRLLENILTRLI